MCINCLDISIREMSGFFETGVERLGAPAAPLIVKKSAKKKKKVNFKKRKDISFKASNKNFSKDEKHQKRKKFC